MKAQSILKFSWIQFLVLQCTPPRLQTRICNLICRTRVLYLELEVLGKYTGTKSLHEAYAHRAKYKGEIVAVKVLRSELNDVSIKEFNSEAYIMR